MNNTPQETTLPDEQFTESEKRSFTIQEEIKHGLLYNYMKAFLLFTASLEKPNLRRIE